MRCLEAAAAAGARRRAQTVGLVHAGLSVAAVLAGIAALYGVTRQVGAIPDSFHEGSVWMEALDEP
jgi:hypothetical protein